MPRNTSIENPVPEEGHRASDCEGQDTAASMPPGGQNPAVQQVSPEIESHIIRAIRGQVPRLLGYRPGEELRLIEPHTYGYGREGQPLLWAYQVWGPSKSRRRSGWKMFRLDWATSVRYAVEGPPGFDRPRPGYQWDHPHFHRVLAQVFVPDCQRREERPKVRERYRGEKRRRGRAALRKAIGLMSAFDFFDQLGREEAAVRFAEEVRWGETGVICPHCGSAYVYEVKSRNPQSHHCRLCRGYFSVRTNTALAKSRLLIREWAYAAYLMITSRKGMSARQLEWHLGCSEKTCWYLGHRIRAAMRSAVLNAEPMSGEVEADELLAGGNLDIVHEDRRKKFGDNSHGNKIKVFGIVERRTGRAYLTTVSNSDKATLQPIIRQMVKPGATVYTDSHGGYHGLERYGYMHETVNHNAKEYVRGRTFTNSIESAFGRFRRMYKGIHHVMSPEHMDLYLGEFSYHEAYRGNDTEALALVFHYLFEADKLSYSELTKRGQAWQKRAGSQT